MNLFKSVWLIEFPQHKLLPIWHVCPKQICAFYNLYFYYWLGPNIQMWQHTLILIQQLLVCRHSYVLLWQDFVYSFSTLILWRVHACILLSVCLISLSFAHLVILSKSSWSTFYTSNISFEAQTCRRYLCICNWHFLTIDTLDTL